jgi:hypothetical protein
MQNAVAGRNASKMSPARFGFVGAVKEPVRNPLASRPMPAESIQRKYQPSDLSSGGSQSVPKMAIA